MVISEIAVLVTLGVAALAFAGLVYYNHQVGPNPTVKQQDFMGGILYGILTAAIICGGTSYSSGLFVPSTDDDALCRTFCETILDDNYTRDSDSIERRGFWIKFPNDTKWYIRRETAKFMRDFDKRAKANQIAREQREAEFREESRLDDLRQAIEHRLQSK